MLDDKKKTEEELAAEAEAKAAEESTPAPTEPEQPADSDKAPAADDSAPSEEAPEEQPADSEEDPAEAPVDEETPSEDSEPDTFPRDYVEKLRAENAKYRLRAAASDDLAKRLHYALTDAQQALIDPNDLPYDESHLDDPLELSRAIQTLLNEKPHLALRRPAGSIGQGASPITETVDLAGMLRARA